MRLIKDGKQPVILIADNTPLSALSAIDNLDWLLVPGIRVQITDQVMIEATVNSTQAWAKDTLDWVERNQNQVEIIETPTGRNYRLAQDAWAASGYEPSKQPVTAGLGETSIFDLLRVLENEVEAGEKVLLIMDDRRGRRTAKTLDLNVDVISTRAFFEVMEIDYGIQGANDYWQRVLKLTPTMACMSSKQAPTALCRWNPSLDAGHTPSSVLPSCCASKMHDTSW